MKYFCNLCYIQYDIPSIVTIEFSVFARRMSFLLHFDWAIIEKLKLNLIIACAIINVMILDVQCYKDQVVCFDLIQVKSSQYYFRMKNRLSLSTCVSTLLIEFNLFRFLFATVNVTLLLHHAVNFDISPT